MSLWTKVKDENEDIRDQLIEQVETLAKDQQELIEVLRGLFVPIQGLTNAYTPQSPYGKAARVLEKHGRYWK